MDLSENKPTAALVAAAASDGDQKRRRGEQRQPMNIEASDIEEGEIGESRLTIFSPLMKWQCSTDSRKEEEERTCLMMTLQASGVNRFPNMELDCQGRLLQREDVQRDKGRAVVVYFPCAPPPSSPPPSPA
ncbi:hypothetical protein LXL04_025741 [Taraxacum kok-saghyz]